MGDASGGSETMVSIIQCPDDDAGIAGDGEPVRREDADRTGVHPAVDTGTGDGGKGCLGDLPFPGRQAAYGALRAAGERLSLWDRHRASRRGYCAIGEGLFAFSLPEKR